MTETRCNSKLGLLSDQDAEILIACLRLLTQQVKEIKNQVNEIKDQVRELRL